MIAMYLHELRPAAGACHRRKRVGRGTASGHGKTAGRGTKGQKARSQGLRLGFEGGQLPIGQRLPKLGGFVNLFKRYYAPAKLYKLNVFDEAAEIYPEDLVKQGLAKDGELIKIVADGNIHKRLTVHAHAFSAKAEQKIIQAGGQCVKIEADSNNIKNLRRW